MHHENESNIKGGGCYTMQTEYRIAEGERINGKGYEGVLTGVEF